VRHAVVGVVRAAAAATALVRLTRAAQRHPPVAVATHPVPAISVVVPARDEAGRIGPLLAAVVGAPGVREVVVVDDESSDATAAIARRAGATVVTGRRLPPGWAGKAWALQQGVEIANGSWVVVLDADTRPDPALPAAVVARAMADGLDLISVAGRFECPRAPLRWLHPAMLTTLLYRAAPPGARRSGPVGQRVANGQCMAARRSVLVGSDAITAVGHHTVEDVALARGLATAGFAVDFLDATDLLRVRMYESAGEAWRGWGRSLSLPGVDPVARRVLDLGVLALAQAVPLLRLLLRRADVIDVVLLAARAGTLLGTARAYDQRGPAYWCSPLADPLAVVAIARGLVFRRQRWRGRAY